MGNIHTVGPNEAMVISGKNRNYFRAIRTNRIENVDNDLFSLVTSQEKVA